MHCSWMIYPLVLAAAEHVGREVSSGPAQLQRAASPVCDRRRQFGPFRRDELAAAQRDIVHWHAAGSSDIHSPSTDIHMSILLSRVQHVVLSFFSCRKCFHLIEPKIQNGPSACVHTMIAGRRTDKMSEPQINFPVLCSFILHDNTGVSR